MNTCIVSDTAVVSPLEVRHFVLTLPRLKSSLQYSAVMYALRPLYPGNSETTAIDFRYTHTGTVGIITARTHLETYRRQGLPLISSSLAAAYVQQDGIAVCISKNWAEFLVIRNGIPCVIQCIAYNADKEKLADCAHNFFAQNASEAELNRKFCVYMLPDTGIDFINSVSQFDTARKVQFEKILNPKVIAACEIFSERNKNGKNSRSAYIIPAVLVLAGFICTGAALCIYAEHKTAAMLDIKRQYEEKKKQAILYEKNARTMLSNTVQSVSEIVPAYTVLTEIQKSGVLWLNSFSMTESSFRMEGEGAAALSVFEKIQQSPLFADVMLHQASPSEIQGDRYIISGNIRND